MDKHETLLNLQLAAAGSRVAHAFVSGSEDGDEEPIVNFEFTPAGSKGPLMEQGTFFPELGEYVCALTEDQAKEELSRMRQRQEKEDTLSRRSIKGRFLHFLHNSQR